jgi:hypothetical protein
MILKTIAILAFLAAAVAVSIEIAAHISEETAQVFFGVLCGIGAAIPVAIGLLMALTRERPHRDADEDEPPTRALTQPSRGETFARGFWTGYTAAQRESETWRDVTPKPRAIAARSRDDSFDA